MKYGIFYEYWEKDWGGDYRKYARKIAELGFDCLEVGAGDLLDMSKDELRELRHIGDGLGIVYSANIGPAKEYDVGSREASVRKKAMCLEVVNRFETILLNTAGGSIARDIKVWRDLGGSADESTKDEKAKKALRFLKERIQ